MKAIYLAGPDVFVPDPIALGARKREICAGYGLEGVFPLEPGSSLDLTRSKRDQGLQIFDRLEPMMRRCDAAIVNMTPFHGPSMDVGSAFEMGYMRALGKPVFAYSNTAQPMFERVKAFWDGQAVENPPGEWRGPEAMQIEDFDMVDNLMMDGCARRSTGVLVTEDTSGGDIYLALSAFERCVKMAAQWFEKERV